MGITITAKHKLYMRIGILLIIALTFVYFAHRATSEKTRGDIQTLDEKWQPYARWRNGVIVSIRNCSNPRAERELLQCASLYCTQRVSELMTNAQQSTLKIISFLRDTESGQIEISGSIPQYSRSPTLPIGFSCSMKHFRHTEPKFTFDTRWSRIRDKASIQDFRTSGPSSTNAEEPALSP